MSTEGGGLFKISSVEKFEEFLENYPNCVLIFYANWCRVCREKKDLVLKESAENLDIPFCLINCSEVPLVAKKYGIFGVPAYSYVMNGEVNLSPPGVSVSKVVQDFKAKL